MIVAGGLAPLGRERAGRPFHSRIHLCAGRVVPGGGRPRPSAECEQAVGGGAEHIRLTTLEPAWRFSVASNSRGRANGRAISTGLSFCNLKPRILTTQIARYTTASSNFKMSSVPLCAALTGVVLWGALSPASGQSVSDYAVRLSGLAACRAWEIDLAMHLHYGFRLRPRNHFCSTSHRLDRGGETVPSGFSSRSLLFPFFIRPPPAV